MPGYIFLVHFQNGLTEEEAIERAAKAGIRVYGLSAYYVTEKEKETKPTVILGYANIEEHEIREAASLLKHAWENKKTAPAIKTVRSIYQSCPKGYRLSQALSSSVLSKATRLAT